MTPRLLGIAWLIAACAAARASTPIEIGDVHLDIPVPDGFAVVTPEMKTVSQLQKSFVPPSNVEYMVLLTKADAAIAQREQIPPMERLLRLQTPKDFVGRSLSGVQFAQLSSVIKEQNAELIERARQQIPALLDKASSDFNRRFDAHLALSVSNMVPFPPHEETERTFGYSMLVKYSVDPGDRSVSNFVVAVTAELVHARAKVLMLYCYGPENDVEWTRALCRNWAQSIVAANPNDFGDRVREAAPLLSRVNRSGVLLGLLIVVVLGLGGIIVAVRSSRGR